MMKAVRYHGQKDIRLDEVEEPKCGKGQVKVWHRLTIIYSYSCVKPAFCGICGTDLHEYISGPNLIPHEKPHPITKEMLPVILGHEFSGVVEEVGIDVENIKVGERVSVQPAIYDGDCVSCQRGLINCCDQNGFIGLSGRGGGMSEHIVVTPDAIKKLPDNVSLEVGALVEPLAVGWHAVSISPYRPGDHVLVLGGGPIGLAVVQALKARACDMIIVSEISPQRKQFAKELGAHYVIDPTKDDVVAEVRRLTNGVGADVAYDAAGVQIGVDTAMLALKVGGMLVNIAVWHNRVTLDMTDFVFRERAYMGISCYALGDFEQVIEAISTGKLTPEAMISRKVKMDEVEDKGFNALINDKDNHVKILVDIGASTG